MAVYPLFCLLLRAYYTMELRLLLRAYYSHWHQHVLITATGINIYYVSSRRTQVQPKSRLGVFFDPYHGASFTGLNAVLFLEGYYHNNLTIVGVNPFIHTVQNELQ